MRRILVAIALLAAVWGGYWFIGATAAETGIRAWLEARRAEGWQADYGQVTTRGFPGRFDTAITDLVLADPHSGLAWSAPLFQILTRAYRPNHIIAAWPHRQTLATPYEKIALTSATMRGSIRFLPDSALTLDALRLDLADFKATSSAGWSAQLATGFLATRRNDALDNGQDLHFEATGARPPLRVLALLDPARLLPDRFQTLRVDLSAGFDAPWDRYAIEKRRPQLRAVDIGDLRATWGELDLQAAGKLSVDAAGIPSGKIALRATNWRHMLQVALDAGWVDRDVSRTVERALELLAGMSGNPDTIDTTVHFAGGWVSIGPIPIGRAPRLHLR